jgi:hypothetical protein
MDDKTNAQTIGKREIVESLDREFARLHVNLCAAIESIPTGVLYAVPAPAGTSSTTPSETSSMLSIGESILRCAATIEQTFGGITSNLWDDPFEWTLPEHLSTPGKVKAHLAEVETTRRRAFSSFADDDCLLKHIAMPSGKTQPLIALLLETLVRAVDYQAQALVVLKILSSISPPRFII